MSERVRIGDLVAMQRGTTYKSEFIGQSGPVLLGLGSLGRHGGFRADALKSYGGASPAALLVQPGDLYVSLKDVTQTADLLGAAAMVPRNGPTGRLTQDTVRLDIKAGETRINLDYLYWMLRTPQYRAYCAAHATGTTTMGLSRDDFFAFELPLPDPGRNSVVSLLGALDDKIAANARLAAVQRDLVSAMYRKLSATAAVWTSNFADIASVGGGGTPKTGVGEFWGGDVAWATPTDVTALEGPYLETTNRTLTAAGLAVCTSPLYPAGSILMTSRATIGAFAIAQRPMAVNQGFIVVNALEPDLQWWLFHQMQARVDEFVSHANGATFLELSRGEFKQFQVLTTDRETMHRFGHEAAALHGRARAALVESHALARTRDTLLPLLMSGQVRVKDAERAVEAVG